MANITYTTQSKVAGCTGELELSFTAGGNEMYIDFGKRLVC